MRFEPVETKDKKGRSVILRSANISDAAAMIKCLKITAEETPFLIREAEETNITIADEENFINARMNAERELMLIATVDGEHAGICSLASIGPFRRYAHRCGMSIALYRKFCGAGIGEIMMQTVLEVAKQIGYEQVELEVVSDNIGAISLYKKLGFEKYGHFPDNMKYIDGRYADADWMMKKL